MTDFRVCMVTVPNPETGEALARSLLANRLAACVNLVPGCRSFYWWENAICDEREELLIIKTHSAQLPALIEHVRSNHPYSCPEVIALSIEAGSAAYLEWLSQSLQNPHNGHISESSG